MLDIQGAVPSEGIDAGTAAHYGDPVGEHRALASGRAFVDLSHWDIVSVEGPDRLAWLNSLTSQLLLSLRAGDSTETLLLDPAGHVQGAAGVVDDGQTTWLLTDPGWGGGWVEFLESMRFMMRVEVRLREELAAIGGFASGDGGIGDGAGDSGSASASGSGALEAGAGESASANGGDLLRARPGGQASSGDQQPHRGPVSAHPGVGPVWRQCAYAPRLPIVWQDPWPGVVPGGATYTADDTEHPAAGWRRFVVVADRNELDDIVTRLMTAGLVPAGALAWEAARIAAWRPRIADVDARALPHEFDWLRTAVHLDKGCYRGQETVAKLVNLGKPPRRLTLLYLEGPLDELPAPGDQITSAGRAAGSIVAAARHPDDGPVALALIRRAVAADAVIETGSFVSGQEIIVDPQGKSSASPARRPGSEFRGIRRKEPQ
ncbi:MAG: folate-binding protein [Actinomycetaceae bacterium]|nr:folate-binding protein [Actinomycetaceae bacterium]